MAFGLVVLNILSNRKWQRPDAQPQAVSYEVGISVPVDVVGFILIQVCDNIPLPSPVSHSRYYRRNMSEE